MPDETKPDAVVPTTTPTTIPATGTGADQKKPDNQPTTTFDPSKISDEEFGKVFDDPRTFQHSRFKELTEAQKELKQLKAQEQKAKEQALAEQGKFKELADAKEAELATLREQNKTQVANIDILAAASRLGAVDPKVVLKLIDRSTITVDENGNVTGAEDAVKKLLEGSPYLKGKGTTTPIGSPTSPDGTDATGVKRFKHSQIKDPVFYREHQKEIDEAWAKGLIENDL